MIHFEWVWVTFSSNGILKIDNHHRIHYTEYVSKLNALEVSEGQLNVCSGEKGNRCKSCTNSSL